MTALIVPTQVQVLRRAVLRAVLAPSVHNTQPWRFVLGADFLELHADPARRLRVVDPEGRQLIISGGCALFNARVAIAAAGFQATVLRYPDPDQPNLLARLTVTGPLSELTDLPELAELKRIASLDGSIAPRRTNRRRFSAEAVPVAIIDQLLDAALAERCTLMPITGVEDRVRVAVLSQHADLSERDDPAYRDELRCWTHDDPRREDGVPALVVPRAGAASHDDVPIRDFDTRASGALPGETQSGLNQCLLLLGTTADNPLAWLQAGEALERILLVVAREGYAVSPITQVIELANTRSMLRAELGLSMQPHVLLRVGRAAATPATRRRRLVDMLTDVGG